MDKCYRCMTITTFSCGLRAALIIEICSMKATDVWNIWCWCPACCDEAKHGYFSNLESFRCFLKVFFEYVWFNAWSEGRCWYGSWNPFIHQVPHCKKTTLCYIHFPLVHISCISEAAFVCVTCKILWQTLIAALVLSAHCKPTLDVEVIKCESNLEAELVDGCLQQQDTNWLYTQILTTVVDGLHPLHHSS